MTLRLDEHLPGVCADTAVADHSLTMDDDIPKLMSRYQQLYPAQD
ncbi:hypothetical protein [Mycobacterium intracellulare]|nr:hypothetical protein [Mycobacterium intracellulare]MEE3754818.1 hypothetical protein [Mycobacterium intracellulare]